MSVKYRATIEFTADRPIRFPLDAQLLGDMEAQLESMRDGTIASSYEIVTGDCRIAELSEPAVETTPVIAEDALHLFFTTLAQQNGITVEHMDPGTECALVEEVRRLAAKYVRLNK